MDDGAGELELPADPASALQLDGLNVMQQDIGLAIAVVLLISQVKCWPVRLPLSVRPLCRPYWLPTSK